MENRALLAFIISMIIITLWTFWFAPQKTPPPEMTEEAGTEVAEETAEADRRVTIDQPAVPVERGVSDYVERVVQVETPLYIAEFSSRGATLMSWKLKDYKESLSKDAPLVDLVSFSPENGAPLELHISEQIDKSINSANFESDSEKVFLTDPQDKSTLKWSHSFSDGLSIIKEFTFYGDRYNVDLSISICDATGKPIDHQLGLGWTQLLKGKSSRWAGFSGPVLYSGNKFDEVKDSEKFPSEGMNVQWAGFTLKYFFTAIVPLTKAEKTLHLRESNGSINMIVTQDSDDPQACRFDYTLFLGPKKITDLKKSEHELHRCVSFGILDIIAKPLLTVLITVNKYTHNYGIAIIILTILIKLLFWPLTHKSFASMKEMQKIQPRMKQLRERFKDNKEQLNREMMLLYKTHKVNPLGGCLPLLMQFPIFIALYRALLASIELRHAPFILWVKDLAAPDYLLNLPPGVSIFGIEGIGPLPLLMGVSMVVQQKLSPSMMDPTQAKIMMLMPIFFTFIFISFPSGLVLYWLINNVLSVVQQVYINSRIQ